MQELLQLLSTYVSSLINGLETLLQTIFYLPILNFRLGYIVIFLIICGFVLHWFIEFISGGDD